MGFLNHLRIIDVPLDAAYANTAAAIRAEAQVSVADAHIGAAVQSAPDADITVVTSDPEDIRRVTVGRAVTVVSIEPRQMRSMTVAVSMPPLVHMVTMPVERSRRSSLSRSEDLRPG